MKLRSNTLLEKIEKEDFVIGTFVELPSPQLVELLGLAGFDFAIIDTEHGSIGLERTEELIRAASSTGISPMVRVSTCEEVTIRRPLDMGAVGLHVPQVSSADMAQLAVRASHFFPSGIRGLQPFVRSASYRAHPTKDYLQESDRDICLVLHIEGEQGVDSLDSILAVDGVNVLFLGPYDLSQSLGVPGQIDHPNVEKKMIESIEKARAAGKHVGTFCDDADAALRWIELGVSYIALSIDAYIFLDAARGLIGEILKGSKRR